MPISIEYAAFNIAEYGKDYRRRFFFFVRYIVSMVKKNQLETKKIYYVSSKFSSYSMHIECSIGKSNTETDLFCTVEGESCVSIIIFGSFHMRLFTMEIVLVES